MDSIAKLLSAAVALGLWANVAVRAVGPAMTDDDYHVRQLQNIIENITKGACNNHKICGQIKASAKTFVSYTRVWPSPRWVALSEYQHVNHF
jgi:hypothetical protein